MSSPASLRLDRLPVLVTATGAILRHDPQLHRPALVLPGSFNPLHAGHWQLGAAAGRLLGATAVYELSVANVDKPDLTLDEVHRRVGQFAGRADVWVTRAPRFTDKAELFPATTFAVGADTALRLVEPRYYHGDSARMLSALALLEDRGCCFLVAPRVDAAGKLLTLADVQVPHAYRALFTAVAPEVFRSDISSTALRGQPPRR